MEHQIAQSLLGRVRRLRDDHNSILAKVDKARARIVTVESLREQLHDVSPAVRGHLATAIGCAEHGYYRPAIVMAWAAAFDRASELAGKDSFHALAAARPKWAPIKSREDLVDRFAEAQIVDAMADAGLITKTLKKTLQGHLHTRNRAAHAGPYNPSFNITLGYLEDLMNAIKELAI